MTKSFTERFAEGLDIKQRTTAHANEDSATARRREVAQHEAATKQAYDIMDPLLKDVRKVLIDKGHTVQLSPQQDPLTAPLC